MLELVYLLVGLALVGFLCWVLITYVPMPPVFKNALVVIVVVVVVIYIAQRFLR